MLSGKSSGPEILWWASIKAHISLCISIRDAMKNNNQSAGCLRLFFNFLLCFHERGFLSCDVLNTLSPAQSLSALLDSSHSAQHSTGQTPTEDGVDGLQSQQAPNLAFPSSGGVGRGGELQCDAVLRGKVIPGQTVTASRQIVPGWELTESLPPFEPLLQQQTDPPLVQVACFPHLA